MLERHCICKAAAALPHDTFANAAASLAGSCCTGANICSSPRQNQSHSTRTPAAAARLARGGTFTDSPMCSGRTRLSPGDAPGDSRLLLDAGDPGDCRPVCLPTPSTSCKQRDRADSVRAEDGAFLVLGVFPLPLMASGVSHGLWRFCPPQFCAGAGALEVLKWPAFCLILATTFNSLRSRRLKSNHCKLKALSNTCFTSTLLLTHDCPVAESQELRLQRE